MEPTTEETTIEGQTVRSIMIRHITRIRIQTERLPYHHRQAEEAQEDLSITERMS